MDNAIYTGLLEYMTVEESSRLEKFKAGWDAYYGRLKKPLKVQPGKMDDNVILNFARLIVDKGVSFLFGQPVGFDIGENQEAAQEWLDAALKQNRIMTLLQKLALNGGVCGTAFIKIAIVPGQLYPRLVVLDPETVSVRWQADDIDTIVQYKIQYVSTDPATGKPVGVRQLIDSDGAGWIITDQVGDLQSLSWYTVGTAGWPYSFPPIVHCQNLPAPNEFWGVSDLEDDIVGVMNAINFVMSNMARIIKNHAHPKVVGKGFTASEIKIDVDGMIILPNPEAQLGNLEMSSDLSSSLNMFLRLKESLHEVSRIPEVATGKLESAGGLSGLALQILYQPLLEKTNTKRLTYGDMLEELTENMLEIGGFGEQEVTLQWQSMLPSDPMQERQAALLDKQLGVSDDTLMQQLGYDPDAERAKREASGPELGEQLLAAFDKNQEQTEP